MNRHMVFPFLELAIALALVAGTFALMKWWL
jgi:hypothetical protein